MIGLAGGYPKPPLLPLTAEENQKLKEALLNLGAKIVG